mmetsp:Transcript_20292/g.40604  ORF Transcript_20292/g.40604 Transcript_20292/m.40604 type:complete len:142 (+) Transcript_20292:2-427(+)
MGQMGQMGGTTSFASSATTSTYNKGGGFGFAAPQGMGMARGGPTAMQFSSMGNAPPQYIPEAEVVHAAPVSAPMSMSPTDVSRVLDSLNLSKYGPLFEKEGVDGSLLLTLDDAALQEVGIDSSLARKKLLQWIENNRGPGK